MPGDDRYHHGLLPLEHFAERDERRPTLREVVGERPRWERKLAVRLHPRAVSQEENAAHEVRGAAGGVTRGRDRANALRADGRDGTVLQAVDVEARRLRANHAGERTVRAFAPLDQRDVGVERVERGVRAEP